MRMLIIIEPTGFAGRYYSEFSIIIAAVIYNTVFYLKIKFAVLFSQEQQQGKSMPQNNNAVDKKSVLYYNKSSIRETCFLFGPWLRRSEL